MTNDKIALKTALKSITSAFKPERSKAAVTSAAKAERKEKRMQRWVEEAVFELACGGTLVKRAGKDHVKQLNAGETLDRIITILTCGGKAEHVPADVAGRFGWVTVREQVSQVAVLRGVEVNVLFQLLRIVGSDERVIPSQETLALVENVQATAQSEKADRKEKRAAARRARAAA